MSHDPRSIRPARVDAFACSRTGSDHAANRDRFVVAELMRSARVRYASNASRDACRFGDRQAHLLVVAGGASELLVDEVMERLLNAIPWTPSLAGAPEAALRDELSDLVGRSSARARDPKAGAVPLTVAFARWPTVYVVHTGGNRAYLLRDGAIGRLTTDPAGEGSPVAPELTVQGLECGDVLLLCSDGLTAGLDDGAIRHVVESRVSARQACEELVEAAARIDGRDDVTVAMARFPGDGEAYPRANRSPERAGAAAALEIPRSSHPPVTPDDSATASGTPAGGG